MDKPLSLMTSTELAVERHSARERMRQIEAYIKDRERAEVLDPRWVMDRNQRCHRCVLPG